jgi:quinol monooxygenase YgiN
VGFAVIATWVAKAGEEETVNDCIRRLIEPSRAEPGNRFYQPNRDPNDPRVFVFYEIFADEEAFEAHAQSDHFRTIGLGEAIPRLASRVLRFYTTVD